MLCSVTVVARRAKRVSKNSTKVYALPDAKNMLEYNGAIYSANLLSVDRKASSFARRAMDRHVSSVINNDERKRFYFGMPRGIAANISRVSEEDFLHFARGRNAEVGRRASLPDAALKIALCYLADTIPGDQRPNFRLFHCRRFSATIPSSFPPFAVRLGGGFFNLPPPPPPRRG